MKRLMIALLFLLLTFSPSHLLTSSAQTFTSQQVPDSVFARMKGRSWPVGCSVPRSELRYLCLLHIDAEGVTHIGEMVCNKAIAQDLLDIFRELYRQRYPIERIRLIDDYDADDERSMRDNNSSCFCYRVVSGSKKLSKHARGMAVDINTRYNPYVHSGKNGRRIVEPVNGTPYIDRSKDFPYKISRNDLLCRLFHQHGFKWGGDWRTIKDWQHFEK